MSTLGEPEDELKESLTAWEQTKDRIEHSILNKDKMWVQLGL